MTPALIWLIAGIVLIAAEVVSGGFVLLMLGLGALAGAAAALSGSAIISVIVFAGASVGLIWLARPALKKRFLHGPSITTGIQSLIGAHGVVVSTVDGGDSGRIRLAGGLWSARSFAEDLRIEPGTKVTVVEIAGATAVVSPEP